MRRYFGQIPFPVVGSIPHRRVVIRHRLSWRLGGGRQASLVERFLVWLDKLCRQLDRRAVFGCSLDQPQSSIQFF
jgi:hypothetical protein